MQRVDTQIDAGWIVPVEPENQVLASHSLIVHQGRILDLLPTDQATLRYQADQRVSRPQHILMPGLVNTHTHSPMSLLRGIADDLPLMTWLQEHIWPKEARWISPDFVRDGTQLAIAEMLLGGTTCFNDMYFFPEIVAETALEMGMRAGIGMIVIEFPSGYAKDAQEYLRKGNELLTRFGQHPLARVMLAPHAPYTVSDASFDTIARLSHEHSLRVHMHVHETADEVAQAVAQTGMRPLARLEKLGLVNSQLVAVHMTQLTDDEIALCAERQVNVIHCPESNLKLASGFCPLAALMKQSINVALGTDGAASNNDLDLWGELRTAALLAKGIAQDAGAVPAHQAIRMATLNGAQAMGWAHEIGSLKVGKQADVIAIDAQDIGQQPMYNVLSHLAYSQRANHVTDVWVAGKPLVQARQLTTIDIAKLRAHVTEWQHRIANT